MGLNTVLKHDEVAVIALLVAVAVAQEDATDMEKAVSGTVGPTGKAKDESTDTIAAPLIAKLRANSNCAGDKCEPVPASCDPTIIGDCEKDMLPPSKISCESIQHCGPCTMHLHCGYMAKEKKCVEGGASGPFNTSLTPAAGDWDYAYCSSDPCSVYMACSACSADPMCGWCSSTNTCAEGSASGPWLNKCNKASFSFDSCAMTVETPAVVTASSMKANMQANVQESAMLLSNE